MASPLRWIVVVLVLEACPGQDPAAHAHWPRWRGPHDTGVAPAGDPPVEWSESKNVRWKVPVPGRGHGTPIVWGDRIYLTAAVPHGEPVRPERHDAPGAHDNLPRVRPQRSVVLCLDRRTGKVRWSVPVHDGLPHEGGHVSASQASASAVTDGEHVIASFGSRGVYGLDRDGRVLWRKDLGAMHTKHAHGEGSSPTLHGNTVVVNWDHQGPSFVLALDKTTGKERWRRERPEPTSWATPIVVVHEGRPQVVVSGTRRIRSYDLGTGELVWECGGLSHNVVASPVAGGGMVFAASSYERKAMVAVRLAGAKGDLTGTGNVVWRRRRRTPYVPSPLLYGDAIYLLHHYQGRLSRVVSETGAEPTGPFRLPGIGNVYASPVGAAGRIYVTDLSGATLVLRHDADAKVLALNRLDDRFSASAAIAGKELFLRGEKHLYCIAAPR